MKCTNCGAEIPNGSVFCSECGAKLKTKKSPIVWIVAVITLLCVIIVPVIVISNNKKAKEVALLEKHRNDSIIVANLAAERARLEAEHRVIEAQQKVIEAERQQLENNKTQVESSSTNKHSLPYGVWSGLWKNGQPHGTGTLKYNQHHLIDKRDRKKRMAAAGDYIIGEFVEGKLVQGTLYDSSNNVKASIIIGL